MTLAQSAPGLKAGLDYRGELPSLAAMLFMWMLSSSERIVGDFHEKAGPCQAVFWSCDFYSRLPTNGRHI